MNLASGGELLIEPRALLVAIYPQLRGVARRMLAKERPGHTLQPTALVNEAVTKLLRRGDDAATDPKFLLNAGIREMQTILIDWGRHHRHRVAERARHAAAAGEDRFSFENVVHLQFCLEKLGAVDERARQVVELRFFTGMTVAETAEFLGLAARTVADDWEFARCWLAKNWAAG